MEQTQYDFSISGCGTIEEIAESLKGILLLVEMANNEPDDDREYETPTLCGSLTQQ